LIRQKLFLEVPMGNNGDGNGKIVQSVVVEGYTTTVTLGPGVDPLHVHVSVRTNGNGPEVSVEPLNPGQALWQEAAAWGGLPR
jgi:hypothetical protein